MQIKIDVKNMNTVANGVPACPLPPKLKNPNLFSDCSRITGILIAY